MRRAAALVLAALAAGGACSPKRDVVVGGGRDVTASDAGAEPTYEHVARRPHGVVALAESRHMAREDAARLTDRLADALEGCASDLERRGTLVEGAARVVMVAGPSGYPAGLNVTLAPGAEVAANALLCVVAPVRATLLPPSSGDAGTPAMAVELTWRPLRGTRQGGPDAAP